STVEKGCQLRTFSKMAPRRISSSLDEELPHSKRRPYFSQANSYPTWALCNAIRRLIGVFLARIESLIRVADGYRLRMVSCSGAVSASSRGGLGLARQQSWVIEISTTVTDFRLSVAMSTTANSESERFRSH